jgi:hypothetical protein
MAKPENTNFLQPTKFILTFPQVTDAVFFCQKVNIPGVTSSELPIQSPNADIYTPGTRIQYGTLDITFLVNENLSSWKVIHDWLRNNTLDQKFRYKNVDATLTVLSNLNNPKIRVKYSNVFPITLGDLEFDTTLSAEEHVTCTASFRVDFFDIEVL